MLASYYRLPDRPIGAPARHGARPDLPGTERTQTRPACRAWSELRSDLPARRRQSSTMIDRPTDRCCSTFQQTRLGAGTELPPNLTDPCCSTYGKPDLIRVLKRPDLPAKHEANPEL